MPVAQTKSSEIIAKLNSHQETPLDELAFSRLKREISKVEEFDTQYMLLGMLSACIKDVDGTIDNFTKSLNLSSNEIICDNYVIALGNLYQYNLAREKAIKFSTTSHEPSLTRLALHYGCTFLDLEQYQSNLAKLRKLKLGSEDNYALHLEEIGLMTKFVESSLISTEDLKKIGLAAMSSLENFRVETIGNNVSLECEDGEKLRIKYYVGEGANVDTIMNVNEHFIGMLIDDDLDLLPVVVSFIESKEAMLKHKEQQIYGRA